MQLFRTILLTCAVVGLAFTAIRCAGEEESPAPVPEGATVHGALDVVGTVPEFSLTNQDGSSYGSAQLDGKVWVATAIFTRSTSNTPQQMAMLEELRQQIDAESLWSSVRLVVVTAEPERDTPAVLQSFAAEHAVDSANVQFLTGDRGEVADLIESLGLSLLEDGRTSSGPLTLSPKFILVDRQHQVRGRYDVFTSPQLRAMMQDVALVLPEAPHLAGDGRTHLVIPPENLNLDWIDTRREAQIASVAEAEVFSEFRFADRRAKSGITFRNKIVDHAGKAWMPNHYDHGNGVAIADVDGDGRTDVYFTSQVGGNELWRNVGNGRFGEITERAGVSMSDRVSVAASFADVDNDGDPDLYVTTVRGGNALFRNDGNGTFTDVSADSGINYSGHSSGAVFFDYDRDGLLDLFLVNVGVYTSERILPVTNGTSPEQSDGSHSFYAGLEDAFAAHLLPGRAERSILFRNLGEGRFEDVTAETGLIDESWSGDATPIDANRDGWPDLYILNMQGADQYYENIGGRRFERRSREVFPETPWGSMGVKAFDYDNDGDLDLYLTDMHSDMSEHVGVEREKMKSRMQWPDSLLADGGAAIYGNAFFRNDGGGAYAEISDQIGAENYWPWGVSIGDLNADGYDDAFVASSMNYPFRYGINSVLLNEKGERFVDSEYTLGVEPRRDGKTLTPWYTLDCGGADRSHQYCQGRVGEALVWGALGSRSSAIFDIEGDGDLDVVTNDFNSEPLVLVSNLAERKDSLNYLKLRLVGTESNRDGLGARITVKAEGEAHTKVLDGVTGYLSHGVHPLYFGLGDAPDVDRIEIAWPSGASQVLEGPIEANRLIVIEEGSGLTDSQP